MIQTLSEGYAHISFYTPAPPGVTSLIVYALSASVSFGICLFPTMYQVFERLNEDWTYLSSNFAHFS